MSRNFGSEYRQPLGVVGDDAVIYVDGNGRPSGSRRDARGGVGASAEDKDFNGRSRDGRRSSFSCWSVWRL